jgi:hypothetical protein
VQTWNLFRLQIAPHSDPEALKAEGRVNPPTQSVSNSLPPLYSLLLGRLPQPVQLPAAILSTANDVHNGRFVEGLERQYGDQPAMETLEAD